MPVASFAPGVMPGTDMPAVLRALESELAPPHSCSLPELPARGHAGTLLGRAAALLPELHADLTSYGWRLTSGAGADQRRAQALLHSDVDALADVRGERLDAGSDVGPLTLQVLGPVSLCAALALPGGEKVLIDDGARRDVTESLAAGIVELTERVRRTSAPSSLRLVVLEPDLHRVRTGRVPTVSGYRTIGALSRDEVRTMLDTVCSAASRSAGDDGPEAAEEVLIDLGRAPESEHAEDLLADPGLRGGSGPGTRSGHGAGSGRGADGFVLPTATMRSAHWERAAELTEAGARCAFTVVAPEEIGARSIPEVTTLADRVARPWRALGMPLDALDRASLTAAGAEDPGTGRPARERLARVDMATALRTAARVRDAAEALEDRRRLEG